MKVPGHVQIFDNGLSLLWWDESGILCSLAKKSVPMTKENLIKAFEVIEKISGGKKICLLADMSLTSAPQNKEAYDYAAEKLKKILKAHAMIASSAFSKAVAKMYLSLKKPPYPAKIFTGENEAKVWLKQFL